MVAFFWGGGGQRAMPRGPAFSKRYFYTLPTGTLLLNVMPKDGYVYEGNMLHSSGQQFCQQGV